MTQNHIIFLVLSSIFFIIIIAFGYKDDYRKNKKELLISGLYVLALIIQSSIIFLSPMLVTYKAVIAGITILLTSIAFWFWYYKKRD